jgi:hypothetical protein
VVLVVMMMMMVMVMVVVLEGQVVAFSNQRNPSNDFVKLKVYFPKCRSKHSVGVYGHLS